jgi:hypothetical protein
VHAGLPMMALGEAVATQVEARFAFVNIAAPALGPVILAVSLALAFATRSAVPLLLLGVILLLFLKTTSRRKRSRIPCC